MGNVASSRVPFPQKTGLAGGQDEALSGSVGREISVPGAGQSQSQSGCDLVRYSARRPLPYGGQTLSWGLIVLRKRGLPPDMERFIFVRWNLKVPMGQGPCFGK